VFSWGQAGAPSWLQSASAIGSVAGLVVSAAGIVLAARSRGQRTAMHDPAVRHRYDVVVKAEFGLLGLGAVILGARRRPARCLTPWLDFPGRKGYLDFPTRKREFMEQRITPQEARAALATVDRGRLRVIGEIDLPRWYWWGLALGWIGLGVITDLKHPWVTAAATLVFGAVHAAVAPRVASGRHRTHALSVRADLAGRQTARLVIGGVVALALVTVAGALAASADGARHPVTIASVFVAVIIVLGGPQLLASVRRRAARSASR
jgi:hypothetical protein